MDIALNNPKEAAAVKTQLQQEFASKGIKATVMDEYNHPSGAATGGHIHVQYANQADAANANKILSDGGTKVTETKPGDKGTMVFFSGVNGAMDRTSAQKIAAAKGMKYKEFGYGDTAAAAAWVKSNPGNYSVMGFSAGANHSTLQAFTNAVKKNGGQMPDRIDTLGMADGAKQFDRGGIPGTDYIDSTGQRHAGEPGVVNLGANTSHLDPNNGGMATLLNQIPAGPVTASPVTAAPYTGPKFADIAAPGAGAQSIGRTNLDSALGQGDIGHRVPQSFEQEHPYLGGITPVAPPNLNIALGQGDIGTPHVSDIPSIPNKYNAPVPTPRARPPSAPQVPTPRARPVSAPRQAPLSQMHTATPGAAPAGWNKIDQSKEAGAKWADVDKGNADKTKPAAAHSGASVRDRATHKTARKETSQGDKQQGKNDTGKPSGGGGAAPSGGAGSPQNNPESAGPTPGSDGTGMQKMNADYSRGGLCMI